MGLPALWARRHIALSIGLFFLALCYEPSPAYSLPSFARQTGQGCSACHVGSFGPQLTSYGRDFKINGYVWGEADNPTKGLSATALTGVEHTQADLRRRVELTNGFERFHTNDNVTVDEVAVFYGGRLLPKVGMMAMATYSDPSRTFAWDHTDIRFADSATIQGRPLVYGITLNNNPSSQDLWQSTPAEAFPYLSSALVPKPAAGPYMSKLLGQVAGCGGYARWNDLLYAELSGYTSLGNRPQLALGEKNAATSDQLSGVAPYWRLVTERSYGQHYVSLGTYGFDADRYPGNDRSQGTDNFLDYALDGTYQYTSNDAEHSLSVYGSALRERQKLNATFGLGGSARRTNHLTELRGNVSYYYDYAYGITLGVFNTTGTPDTLLYTAGNAKPNSSGYTVEVDFTPFGTEKAWNYPNVNIRFFMQYTGYWRFDGLRTNYDGTGRNATDNNALFAGAAFAF